MQSEMGSLALRSAIRNGLLMLLVLLSAREVLAHQVVHVGAYNFPPYIVQAESDQPQGLLTDLLAKLNQLQSKYKFVMVPTSVTRRYQDLASKRFDLIFFESPEWGWKGTAHEPMDLDITDYEVYVTRVSADRDQHYFDDFGSKRLALYSGYHYGFAGFNADRDFLRQHYKAEFSYSHDSNLQKVLHERADIAVVTESFLQMFIDRNPGSREQLLVSTRKDQSYSHQVLLRPGSPVSAQQLRELLDRLRASGELKVLLQRYHL
jgi:ABC-type amino acid transport substrate-binding protein